jgi:hypothetical protein
MIAQGILKGLAHGIANDPMLKKVGDSIANIVQPDAFDAFSANIQNGAFSAQVAVDGLTSSVAGLGGALQRTPSRLDLAVKQRLSTQSQRAVAGYGSQYQAQQAAGMVRAQAVAAPMTSGSVYNTFVFNNELRDPIDVAFLQDRIERTLNRML